MRLDEAREALDKLVAEAKADYQGQQLSNERLQLFYLKPNRSQTVGRVVVRPRPPRSEWRLATPMPLNPRWSEAELERFIYQSIIKLPILRGPIVIH